MRAVRFTKAEYAFLSMFLEEFLDTALTDKERKLVTAVVRKLETAEMPVKSSGLPLAEALAAFREVLGSRLVTPPSGAAGVYAQMTKRLHALGLSRMDCVTIAKAAGVEWQGRIKAESLLRQGDVLLSSSQLGLPHVSGTPRTTAPVELSDDDY